MVASKKQAENEIFAKKILRWITVHQKVPKSYFQSQFWMSRINWIFFNFINLGDHYLLKLFFSKLNFWTTLLSKIMSNFWRTDIMYLWDFTLLTSHLTILSFWHHWLNAQIIGENPTFQFQHLKLVKFKKIIITKTINLNSKYHCILQFVSLQTQPFLYLLYW